MSSDPTTPTTDPQQPVDELAGKLKRTELQRSASSIPGREIVQVLTEIPAGVESGLAHPPRRGGRLHRRRNGGDDDPGAGDAHPARRRRVPHPAPDAAQRPGRWSRVGPDALHLHRRSRAAPGDVRPGGVMSTEDPAAARHGSSSGRAFTTRCRTPATTVPRRPQPPSPTPAWTWLPSDRRTLQVRKE